MPVPRTRDEEEVGFCERDLLPHRNQDHDVQDADADGVHQIEAGPWTAAGFPNGDQGDPEIGPVYGWDTNFRKRGQRPA